MPKRRPAERLWATHGTRRMAAFGRTLSRREYPEKKMFRVAEISQLWEGLDSKIQGLPNRFCAFHAKIRNRSNAYHSETHRRDGPLRSAPERPFPDTGPC